MQRARGHECQSQPHASEQATDRTRPRDRSGIRLTVDELERSVDLVDDGVEAVLLDHGRSKVLGLLGADRKQTAQLLETDVVVDLTVQSRSQHTVCGKQGTPARAPCSRRRCCARSRRFAAPAQMGVHSDTRARGSEPARGGRTVIPDLSLAFWCSSSSPSNAFTSCGRTIWSCVRVRSTWNTISD